MNSVLHMVSLSLWFPSLLSLVIIVLLMLLYCAPLNIVTFYSDYLPSTSGPTSLICHINESPFRLTYTLPLKLFFTTVSNLYSFKEILISPGNGIHFGLSALSPHFLYFNSLIALWISTTLFFQMTSLVDDYRIRLLVIYNSQLLKVLDNLHTFDVILLHRSYLWTVFCLAQWMKN